MLWAGEKLRSVLGCFGSGNSRLQLGAWGEACDVWKSLYQYFGTMWLFGRSREAATVLLVI